MPFYSVYKLVFKPDPSQFYIGSTALGLEDRFKKHVDSMIYPVKRTAQYKLYAFMKQHDKVNDWEMQCLQSGEWKDKTDARKREQEYIEELNPPLNARRAFLSDENKKK